MNNTGFWAGGAFDPSTGGVEAREPGARRKKLAGYLKAANELRQTYSQSYREAWSTKRDLDDETSGMPGAFPGATVTDKGDEQLVVFPSYATRHNRLMPSDCNTISTDAASDQDYWQQQWNKFEDENAIVDIDVRGWIYAPHRGPPTRKHRLLVGLARQLSGIPAPRQSPSSSRTSSRASSPMRISDRVEAHNARKEDELARHEADQIVRRGEAEAQIAGQGAYSEYVNHRADIRDSGSRNGRTFNTDAWQESKSSPKAPPSSSVQAPASWVSSSTDISEPDLATANTHLLTRLQPFLANPICGVPISAFFYNEGVSRQKSVETDTSGHFNFRAALDFVPTHVRILASEHLSATLEIQITEPSGVSVISDIDDTVKHSAIASGAKEIFKNVFVRELADLSIKGVKEWYADLSGMGCYFHYVSNSPWQLYPLLSSFFSAAGLPSGSFHLKQYSGMLQGIFEPVAERKKGTLEKLLRDFPERRFILVGDSGEADLEVYTDLALEYPGRILGVFIRDVTTTTRQRFFDAYQPVQNSASTSHNRSEDFIRSQSSSGITAHDEQSRDEDPDLKEAVRRSLADQATAQIDEDKPSLPPRRTTAPAALEEDLIDLDYDTAVDSHRTKTAPRQGQAAFRSTATSEKVGRKPAPPRPARPSTAVRIGQKGLGGRETGDTAAAGPDDRPALPVRLKLNNESLGGQHHEATSGSPTWRRSQPSPPPQRRNRDRATEAGVPPTISNSSGLSEGSPRYPDSALTLDITQNGQYDPQISRKEEAWLRRWARAKEILGRQGVALHSWRVGEDARMHSMRLVQKTLRDNRDHVHE